MDNQPVVKDAEKAADTFMRYHYEGTIDLGSLDRIIRIAVSENISHARAGTRILFDEIIEPLSDTFLITDRKVLEQVLARIITRIRQLHQSAKFHEKLLSWGLTDEISILHRVDKLYAPKNIDTRIKETLRKVIVLSRVTLGADVLFISLLIDRVKRLFPDTEIVILGNEKNCNLLKGKQSGIRGRIIHYNRRDILTDRFLSWLDVLAAMEKETVMTGSDGYIVVNADSRLLQSGLLPIISPEEEDTRYFFWHPGIDPASYTGSTQAEDFVQWLDTIMAPGVSLEAPRSRLHLDAEDIKFAGMVHAMVKMGNPRAVVTMSFGVGGNNEKRITEHDTGTSCFEELLVKALIEHGASVILDKGAGSGELSRADKLASMASDIGIPVVEIHEKDRNDISGENSANPRLALFEGSVAKLAALISLSDVYIGYDSLGQHLAAVTGKNLITIFAGYRSDIFPVRWRPYGSGHIRVVAAGSGPFSLAQQEKLVEEVIESYYSVCKLASKRNN